MKSKPLAVLFAMTAASLTTTVIPTTAQGADFANLKLKSDYQPAENLPQQLTIIKSGRINPHLKAREEGTTKPPRDLTGLSPLIL